MARKFSTKTPVKLQDSVFKAFTREYAQIIEEHGASYAVNVALALHLRRRGHTVADVETSAERIARSQHNRWESVRRDVVVDLAKAESQREAKRERDRRYRAKRKASKATNPEE